MFSITSGSLNEACKNSFLMVHLQFKRVRYFDHINEADSPLVIISELNLFTSKVSLNIF